MPKFAKWPKTLGMTSKKNIAFPEGNNYELSAEDITSDYRFLLRLVNTFPIDTDEYITQCVTKLNCAKRPLKTLYIILQYVCYLIIMYITGSFNGDL